MEKKSVDEEISEKLVGVLIVSLFTIVLWGGVQIVEALSTKPTPIEYQKHLRPISQNYDTGLLEEFLARTNEEFQPISKEKFNPPNSPTGNGTPTTNDTGTSGGTQP